MKAPQVTAEPNVPATRIEVASALLGSAWVGVSLFLAAIYAGPLWRDETNTVNVALMPARDLWNNLPFESFPPLWMVIVRIWSHVSNSDEGIRLLCFFVGLLFLGSLWLCARWTGVKVPTVSIALLGSLPAFVFGMSSNRAYGLALSLLLLSFGALWRFIESPSKPRLVLAAAITFLFAHCLYYDAIFLGAMLFGAAMVLARRKDWRNLLALSWVGLGIGLTLLIYYPVVHTGASYGHIMQIDFDLSLLIRKLREACSLRTSAELPVPKSSVFWLWLLLAASAAFKAAVSRRSAIVSDTDKRGRDDLLLYSILSLVCGALGYFAFLLRLRFPTQSWYYLGLLTLVAVAVEAVLSTSYPARRFPKILRTIFLVVILSWSARAVWREAHTRRSNVDLVAAILNEKAMPGDLIVVHFAFEGITFDRYYKGSAQWTTIPPIDSHKVHRSDLIWEKMNRRDTMNPVLQAATKALQAGNNVWVVGHVPMAKPDAPPLQPLLPSEKPDWYLGEYGAFWGAQLTAHLLGASVQSRTFVTSLDAPVNLYEDLPLIQFSGCKAQTH